MQDKVRALVRTTMVTVWAAVAALLLKRFGVEDLGVEQLSQWSTEIIMVLLVAVVQAVIAGNEGRFPILGWLLGMPGEAKYERWPKR